MFTIPAYAQTATTNLNNVATPSPNATSEINGLGKYDVNLYTGRLNYNAPISTISMSKVRIPVGVSFCSSGIKVQDIDGPVGIGWKLSAGGLITRSTRNLPDESTNGYCGPNRVGGINYSRYNNANMTWVNNVMNNDNTKTTWDAEPDQFYFSFLGFSGLFVLDVDGNPVLQSSYGLKIKYSPFNRTSGRMTGGAEDWILVDLEGNQYYFGDAAVETSTVTMHGQAAKNTFTQTYISSWYISKIVTADNQVINFQYQTYSASSYTNYRNVELVGYNQNGTTTSTVYSENTDISVPSPLYLSKITSAIEEIDFIYNNTSSYPYLTEVDELQRGVLEYKYQLNYNSLVYNDGSPTRHVLNYIKQISPLSGNSIKLFQFGYNTGLLPPRSAPMYDYWGYLNSNPSASLLGIYNYQGTDKTPDPVQTAANMLTSVTNVNGGVINFIYEQNDINNNNDTNPGSISIGGLRIRSISTSANGVVATSTSYSYKMPSSNASSGQEFNNHSGSYDHYQFLYPNDYYFSQSITSMADLTGTEVGYSWVTTTNADGSSVRYHFTNFSEYPDVAQEYMFYQLDHRTDQYDPTTDYYTLNWPKSSYAFARGKELSEEDIDNSGRTIKQTTITYTPSTPINDVMWIKIAPYVGVAQVLFSNPDNIWYAIHKADFSTIDLLPATKTVSVNFYTNNTLTGSTATTENYTYKTYAGNNFLASQTTTLSNGNTQKIIFRYPFDVLTTIPSSANSSLPISYLVLNNIIGQPVETVTSVIKGGTETVTGVKLTRYFGTAMGTVKPSSDYRLKISGLLKSNYQSYSVTPGTGSETETVDNTNLEQTMLYTMYDSYGNLTESNNPYTTNGQTVYVWGYGGDYLIAKASNARSNQIFYQSFEENTGTNVISGAAHSGTHYYSGTSYLITGVVPTGINYLISYWYLSGSTWKYSGPLPYNGSATLSNGTGYDDICIFPTDALMNGYAYEPMVGLLSSEDSKGQSAGYEYDEFKRLLNVRDMNNNIIKNYTYYIQGQ